MDHPPQIWPAVQSIKGNGEDTRLDSRATNAIESLNYSLRKLLRTRGAFPNDDSIVKILYLAINRVAKKWTMPIRDWKAALNQFVILFGDRVPV